MAIGGLFACAHARREEGRAPSDLEQARLFLRRGQPQRALPLLAKLEGRSPDAFEVVRLKAEAFVRLGRGEELRQELASTARKDASSHYLLALLYAASSAEPERGAASAARELEAALALAPGEAELHYRLGLALLCAKRPRDAAGALRRALELNPARTAPYLPLAKALHELGQPQEALVALSQWAALRPPQSELASAKSVMDELVPPFAGLPKGAQPIFVRALAMLEEQDDPLGAMAVLLQLAREHPDAAIIHTLWALCHRRLDDAAPAIDELQQAMALAPSDGRNHQYLGEIYLERKQPAPARVAFERALKLNPLLEAAHLGLAQLSLEESDLAGAEEHLLLAVSVGQSLEVRARLAAILESTGKYPEAIGELGEIRRRQPENPIWPLRLGLLYLRAYREGAEGKRREQSRAEAIRWLREALRLQGDNVTAATALRSVGGS